MSARDHEGWSQALDAVADGVLVANPDGLVRYMNPAGARLTGWSVTEVDGLPVARVIRLIEDLPPREEGAPPTTDTPARRGCSLLLGHQGRVISVEWEVRPLPEAEGTAWVLRECPSGQPRRDGREAAAETALAATDPPGGGPTDATVVAAWTWTGQTGLVTWSDELYRLLDVTRQDFVPTVRASLRCLHPDDRAVFRTMVRAVSAHGRALALDVRVQRADGQIRVLHTQVQRTGVGQLTGTAQDVTERIAQLRAVHTLSSALEQTADPVVITDANGIVEYVNPAFEQVTGYPRDDVLGERTRFLDTQHYDERKIDAVWATITAGEPYFGSVVSTRKDGGVFQEEKTITPIRDPRGNVTNFVSTSKDTTEQRRSEARRRRLERQALTAQKLESLGVLAGGIAHDFNNLLMGVLGNASLALMEIEPNNPARHSIEQIETAAQRAAELTRQLLAYSGKGKFVVRSVDLNRVVSDMEHLLEAAVSKKVDLRTDLDPTAPPIEGDVAQLRQVVMNLVTNGSDALHDRPGHVIIRTEAVALDRGALETLGLDDELAPGRYVTLEITDTGEGMDEPTRQRIFEPFFSTKFTGRGLGLPAVQGIVRGHGGGIDVATAPGRGTEVRLFFPAATPLTAPDRPRPRRSSEWQGCGTVLLVDDERTVRDVTSLMLTRLGFSVLLATDGREGVEMYQAHRDEIVVVLLDMTMPHMGGEQTFEAMKKINPDVRVVLSSGFDEQEATGKVREEGWAGFLAKPYRPRDLSETLQRVLEAEVEPDHR